MWKRFKFGHVFRCHKSDMDSAQEQLQKAKYGGLLPKKKLLAKVSLTFNWCASWRTIKSSYRDLSQDSLLCKLQKHSHSSIICVCWSRVVLEHNHHISIQYAISACLKFENLQIKFVWGKVNNQTGISAWRVYRCIEFWQTLLRVTCKTLIRAQACSTQSIETLAHSSARLLGSLNTN